ASLRAQVADPQHRVARNFLLYGDVPLVHRNVFTMAILSRVADAECRLAQERRERVRQSGIGLLRQGEVLADICVFGVESAELAVAVENAAAHTDSRLAVERLRRPSQTHARSEILRVRKVERRALRTVLQSAGERIEDQAGVVLVVVDA